MELNLPAAQAARDAAINAVEVGANETFKQAAYEALCNTALTKPVFLVDDVWMAMGLDAPQTHEKRAMGAVILRAVREGVIRKTGQMRPSAQPQCHANPRTEWTAAV